MPKISVIMPVYNAEKYIREAIESILNQTFEDFEFIIINDGSTDFTKSIIESNNSQIKNLVNRILMINPSRVGMIGISFKKGTDDMRESPYVEVAKYLIGEGVKVKVYDPLVRKECLVGSNKKHFYKNFKNVDRLLVSSVDELFHMDLIIINHSIVDSRQVNEWMSNKIKIIDLVNIEDVDNFRDEYEGIYW